MENLLPNIPEEIRAARIGTCYDPITRRLMQEKIAINPERLSANSIEVIAGKAELKLHADSSTSKSAQSTFFALDSNFKAGSWVSAGFNMESSNIEVNERNSLNCYCSYIYSGQALQLIDNGAKALFNCMTDEFQEMFTDLISSSETPEFFVKYMNFINTFGYGCVTKLMLTCGSAFVMTADYSSKNRAMKSRYGASLGVGTPWGGGSVASNFASEVQKTDSNATLDIKGESIPQDAPTNGWCDGMMSSLFSLGLAKLSKDPGLISPYSGTPPKAPEVPKGEPTKKELPNGSGNDVSDEMKKKLMKADGFTRTWSEYLSAQKAEFEKIKPGVFTQKLCENLEQLLKTEIDFTATSAVPDPEPDGLSDAWDLGGYIPYSYVVKPWTELFAAQMKGLALPVTFTSIYIAKTYMYYITQIQFASYMNLLSDFGPVFADNANIVNEASMFSGLCGELLNNINAAIKEALNTNGTFTNDDYKKVAAAFEQKIDKLYQSNRFYSATTRRKFFENYDFFIGMAGGTVTVLVYDDGKMYYMDGLTVIEVTKQMSVATMIKDSLRTYHCLSPSGNLQAGCFCINHICNDANIAGGLSAKLKKDESNRSYYILDDISTSDEYSTLDGAKCIERRQYIVSFDDMKDATTVLGGPMIADFDFDCILDFANPDRAITSI